MNDKINIPQESSLPLEDGFRPFKFTIKTKDEAVSSDEQTYYLHQCNNLEYRETILSEEDVKAYSTFHPESVFFRNDNRAYNVSQLDSNRDDTATEEEALSGDIGTLYFVNEEESES